MEKDFIYTNSIGWNWHKSWNIPNMEITAKVKFNNNFLYSMLFFKDF